MISSELAIHWPTVIKIVLSVVAFGGVTGSILALMGEMRDAGNSTLERIGIGFVFGTLLTMTGVGAVFIPWTYASLLYRVYRSLRQSPANMPSTVSQPLSM